MTLEIDGLTSTRQGRDRLPAARHRRLRRDRRRRWRRSSAAPARRPARRSSPTRTTFGYRWMVLRDPDVEDLAVGVNAVSDALAVGGYGDRVLCAVFAFADANGEPLVLHLQLQARRLVPVRPAPAARSSAPTSASCSSRPDRRGAADRGRARALVPALGRPDLDGSRLAATGALGLEHPQRECARRVRTPALDAGSDCVGDMSWGFCGSGTPYCGGTTSGAHRAAKVRSAAVKRSPVRKGRPSASIAAAASNSASTLRCAWGGALR